LPDSPAATSYAGLPPTSLAELIEAQVVGVESAIRQLTTDPEGMVHDARVALRTLRSSLSTYSSMLEPEAAKPLRRELSWLAGELGPARDAQVMLARMKQAVSPADVEDPAVAGLLAHFEGEEARAFDTAREAVASDRFEALVARLDVARLRSLVTTEETTAETRSGIAGRHLSRLLRDLEAVAGATDERLHDLRKAVKRARYVRGTHDDVDSALKRLQGVLGEHQDSVVARERLGDLPASDLVATLVSREEAIASDSEAHLGKAVRKLRKVLDRSGASYT
jgi:CHAD domain-containing protein